MRALRGLHAGRQRPTRVPALPDLRAAFAATRSRWRHRGRWWVGRRRATTAEQPFTSIDLVRTDESAVAVSAFEEVV
ncbi:hypothetical protein [Asanoa sp. NPDC050611]|uniref:hypothetical protein n=1 Tax=Asanoa sp. NPDC050611 TaxID=3157098 RepID=UPI0033F3116D